MVPHPRPTVRQLIIGAIALLLAVILIARWVADWGLVTIHAKDQPLSTVIASISRQGGVRIESSLDPSKLVSMEVVKVTPATALATLASASDAGWRVVYLAAPTTASLNEAVLSLKATGKIDNWVTSYYPEPGGGWGGEYGQEIDPRSLAITIEGNDRDLGKLLDEASQKSGVMTAFPKDWSPLAALPKPTRVSKAISSIVNSAHGTLAEFFFLTEPPRRVGSGGGAGEGDRGPEESAEPKPYQPARFPMAVTATDHPPVNPAWVAQRQEAMIKKLPTEKQPEARKYQEETKAFFDSLKGLSRQERMAKVQDAMANSELGEKMMDAQLLRRAQQSPESRITRAVSYLNRKAATKAPSK